MDVKKATDADIPEITKNIEILKSKQIEIATTTLQGAVRRGSKIPKEDTEALTDEISKLLESIIAFQNGAAESLSLPNKAAVVRALNTLKITFLQ